MQIGVVPFDLSCAVPVLLLLGTEGQVNMQLMAIMMLRPACAEKVAAAVAVVIVVTVVDVVAAGRRSCGGSGRKGSHGGSVRGRNPLLSSCYSQIWVKLSSWGQQRGWCYSFQHNSKKK